MVAYTFYKTDNRVRRYAEALVQRGDNVDAIALQGNSSKTLENVCGVNVYKIQKRQYNERSSVMYLGRLLKFLFKSFLLLSRLHLKRKYDLVHVHSVPDFEVFCTLFVKFTGTKVILDIHDAVPELYCSKFNASRGSLLFNTLVVIEWISCHFADHVIVANDVWHERIAKRSARKKGSSVIMNYPDPRIFQLNDRQKPEKDAGKFVLIYPGTLSKHQGIDTVIFAVNKVRKDIPGLEFRIYGKGSDADYFAQLIKELHLEQIVSINGARPSEEIAELLSHADVGIEPKTKVNLFSNEAFSTKILEFMLSGIPVIASDTLIHKYYIDGSLVKYFRAGDIDDLAESILFIYKEKSFSKNMIERASHFIKSNTWDVKKYKYLELVDSLVKKATTGIRS